MSEITETVPAEVWTARRRFEAHVWYLCALHAQAWTTPAPPEVLEELEMDARFEYVANQELRRL